MPRNGSGVFSLPAGTAAVPNTTIKSADYNSALNDLAADMNTPRPIIAGGTGASTAGAALAALGGQPKDNTLTRIAALGTAANKFIYTTGVDTWAEAAITSFGRSLLNNADAGATRTTLGLKGGALLDVSSNTNLSVDSGNLPTRGAVKQAIAAAPNPVKAWVFFDGTGTPTILSSFNVSSITYNGTGKYSINFASAMPHANYAVSACASRSDAYDQAIVCSERNSSFYAGRTVNSVDVICMDTRESVVNGKTVSVVIYA